MSVFINKISITILLLGLWTTVYSQSKAELQQRRTQIIQELQEGRALLKVNQNESRTTQADLRLLEKQVSDREELIRTIKKEGAIIDAQIKNNQNVIGQKEAELAELKLEYETAVVNAYKKRSGNNQMLFLLSAKNFNNAMRRLNYLKKYSAHKKHKASNIRSAVRELENKRSELVIQREEKSKLEADQRSQQAELTAAKAKVEQAYAALKKEGKQLNTLIAKKVAEANKLEKEIERIIAREIEEERKRLAAIEARNSDNDNTASNNTPPKTSNTTKNSFALTPAAAKLSSSFTKNRGKLPWPVETGVVSIPYGEVKSREMAGIKTKNNGIDVRTAANSAVRAIFNGEVRSITTIPGYNKVIIVNHGEYFTVYAKLKTVTVSVGEKVSTKQQLGTVDTIDGSSEIHLEIWKGQQSLNPSSWIAK